MAIDSRRPPHPEERSTLGRLGGLSRGEAARGERVLWLSGGGYRAAIFHLGALMRLNELGLLEQVGTVGAVAGGSIMAALLATRIAWPLQGAYRGWTERVAEPMRAIARRGVGARAARRPFPGAAADAALEERYARELADSLGGESQLGPRFVFGASGLALSGLAAERGECLEWELEDAAGAPAYGAELVAAAIAALPTHLEACAEAEAAVLENHGYLLAEAAVAKSGLAGGSGRAEPPHPEWMDGERVREALGPAARRGNAGRLRGRWARRL
jgi:hypothetical protein